MHYFQAHKFFNGATKKLSRKQVSFLDSKQRHLVSMGGTEHLKQLHLRLQKKPIELSIVLLPGDINMIHITMIQTKCPLASSPRLETKWEIQSRECSIKRLKSSSKIVSNPNTLC